MMQSPPKKSGWLNARSAGRLAGKSDATIRNWVRNGYLPGQLAGPQHRVRVRREDLLKLMASWQVPLDYKKVASGERDED